MSLALDILNTATEKLVDCEGCSKCCTNGGPAYVLAGEVDRLNRLGVRMFSHKGHYFIQRVEGGVCSMLDTTTGRCKIYDHRPTSCKLFPLDIFEGDDGDPEWVLFDYCPPKHRIKRDPSPGSPSEMEIARAVAARLGKVLSQETLQEITDATVAAGEIDIFDPHRTDAVSVGPVS